jgi:hypothetical protein
MDPQQEPEPDSEIIIIKVKKRKIKKTLKRTLNKSTTKKCLSGCKLLDRDICTRSTRCKFVDGQSRKYCRLSGKYKMAKPGCKVVKRSNTKVAAKKISKFLQMAVKEGPEKKASYLKAICSDSGVCIAFGNNRKKINQFFGGFNNFAYVDPPIKRLGKPSNNGFVKEIKYNRNNYLAYAVLKSSAAPDSDNLAYEYLVGQFINNQCQFYPCFLETYGFYYYKNAASWKSMKDSAVINANVLPGFLEPGDPTDFSKMCYKSKYGAVLIQHLKDAKTVNDLTNLTGPALASVLFYEMIYILYQVYMPLAQLKNNFTHYDLHDGNLIVYEPIKGKHIQYHYHIGGGQTVSFKSPYISKIIDYGRSYFKYKGATTQLDSSGIYREICNEPDCNIVGNCGDTYGFEWMTGPLSNQNYFISSQVPNMSHDLRLLNIVRNTYNDIVSKVTAVKGKMRAGFDSLHKLLDKVQFGKGVKGENKIYGTNVNKKMGYPEKINNVADAERCLRDVILENQDVYELNEARYKPENKIGDIHVYVDGEPMRFEPV